MARCAMFDDGLVPIVITYSAAISACEKWKHWEEALHLLQEMLRRSLTPNVVSCNSAMNGAAFFS